MRVVHASFAVDPVTKRHVSEVLRRVFGLFLLVATPFFQKTWFPERNDVRTRPTMQIDVEESVCNRNNTHTVNIEHGHTVHRGVEDVPKMNDRVKRQSNSTENNRTKTSSHMYCMHFLPGGSVCLNCHGCQNGNCPWPSLRLLNSSRPRTTRCSSFFLSPCCWNCTHKRGKEVS